MTSNNDILRPFSDPAVLTPGELVYDLVRSSPMIVISYKGALGDLEKAKREQITNAYTNNFVHYTRETGVYEAVYTNLRNRPKKTYSFPATRLARPEVESATPGEVRGSELAQVELLARMFTLLGADGDKEHFANLVEGLARDAVRQWKIVDEARRRETDVVDAHDDDTLETFAYDASKPGDIDDER